MVNILAIDKKVVEHVALLSRLQLSEEEKEQYTGQLNAILGYMEKLNKLDTTDIPPTAHVLPLSNVFRDDVVKPSMDRTKVVANAPDEEDGQFRVPKIV